MNEILEDSFLESELVCECPQCRNNNIDICYRAIQKLYIKRNNQKKTLDFWEQLYKKTCANNENVVRMREYATKKRSKKIHPVNEVNLNFGVNKPCDEKHVIQGGNSCRNFLRNKRVIDSFKKRTYLKKNVKRKKSNCKHRCAKNHEYVDDIPNRYNSYDDESVGKQKCSELPNNDDYYDDDDEDDDYDYDKLNSTCPSRCSCCNKMKPSISRSYSHINDQNEWRHRLTIPEPFEMTLREANKVKKKSKSLLMYEKQQEESKRLQDCECKKTFKAKPVPAHVHVPLFEEMMRNKEKHKSSLQKCRQEHLKSMQRPFSFAERNKEKNKVRKKPEAKVNTNKTKKKTNKRKPSLEKDAADNEQISKLNQMLKNQGLKDISCTPKGLETCEKLEKCFKNCMDGVNYSFTPNIHDYIPNYDALHKEFQKELSKKKLTRKNTITQPFNFRTDDVALKRYLAKQEKNKDPPSPHLSRRKSYSCPSVMNAIPSKTTESAQLRKSANLMKIANQIPKGCGSDQCQYKHLRKEVQDKVRSYDKSPIPCSKIPSYLKQQQEYLKQLREIYNRLKNRPLLFEQAETKNAKMKAEKKFFKTLKEHGIDCNMIERNQTKNTKCRRSLPHNGNTAANNKNNNNPPPKSIKCPKHGTPVPNYEATLNDYEEKHDDSDDDHHHHHDHHHDHHHHDDDHDDDSHHCHRGDIPDRKHYSERHTPRQRQNHHQQQHQHHRRRRRNDSHHEDDHRHRRRHSHHDDDHDHHHHCDDGCRTLSECSSQESLSSDLS
ncbi:protein FAM161B-like [Argonauta hians]